MSEPGINYVVHLNVDSASAASSIDTAATSMLSATRRAASGVGGLLSSTENLYNAQQRLNVAQISYTLAVREYGAGSIQAARAQDEVTIATNGLTVAQDRLYVRYLTFALSVGPQVYSALMKMMAASAGMTAQNYIETASWYAKAAAAAVAIGVISGGILLVSGLAAGAQVSNTINQQNNFYQSGANSQAAVNSANQSLVSGVASANRR